MKNAKDFFKANPNAEAVLQVGEQFFTTNHRGAAMDTARRLGVEMEEHPNDGAKTKGVAAKEKAATALANLKSLKAADKAAADKVAADQKPAGKKKAKKGGK